MGVYISFANSQKYLTKYLTTLLLHTPNIDYIANTHTTLLIHTLYLDQIFLHIWTKYFFIFGPKYFFIFGPKYFFIFGPKYFFIIGPKYFFDYTVCVLAIWCSQIFLRIPLSPRNATIREVRDIARHLIEALLYMCV